MTGGYVDQCRRATVGVRALAHRGAQQRKTKNKHRTTLSKTPTQQRTNIRFNLNAYSTLCAAVVRGVSVRIT